MVSQPLRTRQHHSKCCHAVHSCCPQPAGLALATACTHASLASVQDSCSTHTIPTHVGIALGSTACILAQANSVFCPIYTNFHLTLNWNHPCSSNPKSTLISEDWPINSSYIIWNYQSVDNNQIKVPLNRETLESHIRHTTKERHPHGQVSSQTQQSERPRQCISSPKPSSPAETLARENYLDEPQDTELKRIIINSIKESRV